MSTESLSSLAQPSPVAPAALRIKINFRTLTCRCCTTATPLLISSHSPAHSLRQSLPGFLSMNLAPDCRRTFVHVASSTGMLFSHLVSAQISPQGDLL